MLTEHGQARRLLWKNTPLNIFVKSVIYDIAYPCRTNAFSEFEAQDLATILSDTAHSMLFDKLSYRPSGYRCSCLVDHWMSCPFSATATNAAFFARCCFNASEAYHYILVLGYACLPYDIITAPNNLPLVQSSTFFCQLDRHRRCQGSGERQWRCVAVGDVKGGAVIDFTSSLEDRASVDQRRRLATVCDMIDFVPALSFLKSTRPTNSASSRSFDELWLLYPNSVPLKVAFCEVAHGDVDATASNVDTYFKELETDVVYLTDQSETSRKAININ
eukprot:TsM_000162800 transcript=TsM_000162800 gene=TsM_000162800